MPGHASDDADASSDDADASSDGDSPSKARSTTGPNTMNSSTMHPSAMDSNTTGHNTSRVRSVRNTTDPTTNSTRKSWPQQ